MNELKKNFVLLVLYLLMIFTIQQLYYGDEPIFQFPSHFYFLIVFVVFGCLFVPRLRWMSFTTLMAFWAIMFFLVVYFYTRINGYYNLQILAIEFILIEVAVWISFQTNIQLGLAESLMDNLASATYANRTIDLRAATDRIDLELTRSRRHHRPLTVLVIEPEQVSIRDDQEAYKLLRHDLLRHFVHARIGQIVTDRVRQTDLIMRDANGRFVILCAETSKESSNLLGERIETAIVESMGASVAWSVASFPEEALTFDELIQKAKQNMILSLEKQR